MSHLMISTFGQNLRPTISAAKTTKSKKIKSQPRKDQKNGTSKNDLKSGLGALNQKL